MSALVKIEGDQIFYSVANPAQAKLAIKELKLLKRGFALRKKELVAEMQLVRFSYSQEVRSRGSMMRGGGGLGRFVRAIQSVSRDSKRAALANALHPLEVQKGEADGMMLAIDQLVVKLEVYIHSQA